MERWRIRFSELVLEHSDQLKARTHMVREILEASTAENAELQRKLGEALEYSRQEKHFRRVDNSVSVQELTELRAQLSESQAALDGLRVLKEGAEKELKETRKDLSAEILSTKLASRRLREALSNLRDWAVANTTTPIHDLLAFTDSAISAPSDEQLIERVVEGLEIAVSIIDSESGIYKVSDYVKITQLIHDLKGAANE